MEIFAFNLKLYEAKQPLGGYGGYFHKLKELDTNGKSVIFFPDYTSIRFFADLEDDDILSKKIFVGAQAVYPEETSAAVGKITAKAARAAGCRYALVGHSFNRAEGLKDEEAALMVKSCLENELSPVICIGESKEEHLAKVTLPKLEYQLLYALRHVEPESFSDLIVAYEPIWSIGKDGIPAEPSKVNEILEALVSGLAGTYKQVEEIRFLYGGNIVPENVASFIGQPMISGVLVGGASADAEKVAEIVNYEKQ